MSDTKSPVRPAPSSPALQTHAVWDAGVRWFHWINVLCVLGLIGVGIVILNANALGVSSEGKVDLKILHAWLGYAFSLNLLWRVVWGFSGASASPSSRFTRSASGRC